MSNTTTKNAAAMYPRLCIRMTEQLKSKLAAVAAKQKRKPGAMARLFIEEGVKRAV